MTFLPVAFVVVGALFVAFARRGRDRVWGLNVAIAGALLLGLQRYLVTLA